MTVRAFIFDLDGVITDTAEYHFLAWRRLAGEEGLEFNRQDNEKLRGVSRRESLVLVLKGKRPGEAKIGELMERKNSYYLDYVRQMSAGDLLPGARDLLKTLRHRGLKIALASSSKNARLVLEKLEVEHLFDLVADGNNVRRAKPAPDLFLFAAAGLEVEPESCIVVEDAASGIEAARAARMTVIGIGPTERVGKADFIYGSLTGICLADVLLS